jgi:hypothetical protein
LLSQIVAARPELAGLPVLASVDSATERRLRPQQAQAGFPVGGTIEVRADSDNPQLTITRR